MNPHILTMLGVQRAHLIFDIRMIFPDLTIRSISISPLLASGRFLYSYRKLVQFSGRFLWFVANILVVSMNLQILTKIFHSFIIIPAFIIASVINNANFLPTTTETSIFLKQIFAQKASTCKSLHLPLQHQSQETAGLVMAWTPLTQHGVDQKQPL